ncbi:baseplate multidomain protein megatron [Terricaulis silvestris]
MRQDLPLDRFGNTIPQLSFEIVRPAPQRTPGPRFEDRVKAICLIPGSGEFVYATEPVMRRIGPGQETAENVHAERDRANLLVSLDQLQQDFPNCESVLLVVSWFGDDLRCGECQIRPGVELDEKSTTPVSWRAGGVTRGGAHVVSQFEGAPAYGGTPSDASVLQAIAALKARGYAVSLYPFVLMDVSAGDALPDPYGAAEQAAYPWRGRITPHPAVGQLGAVDKTGAAATQIESFFGAAAPSDFGAGEGVPTYSGPNEWSYRRFVLHHAKLAALAGGVDAFIIGSELRALTTARDSATSFPVVAALRDLASDVLAMLGPSTTLTYAADWSEYGGYRPQDGSGDVLSHLDPLWADDEIDVVGIDWYPPLTDWRDGIGHLDATITKHPHDSAYLESRIEAGENYDWFYASDADRAAQTRTSITDGAHAEPWIYRAKDVRNFWAHPHFDRPAGVRAASPTAWTPESKPVWLIELGCPAIDKGANAPNLFIDAKSAESMLPPFSSGARDDLIQRRTLEAYLRYWDAEGEANPVSSLTGLPMIERAFLWAWDARPHPAFPALSQVWSDGPAWRRGHWLNGRAGLSMLGEVVTDICARADAEDVAASALVGALSGYVVDAPMEARAALEPLMAAYDFGAAEREGAIVFFHADDAAPVDVAISDLTADTVATPLARRSDAADAPIEARVRFIDAARDYLIGGASARRLDRAEVGVISLDAPLVLEAEAAERIAQSVLADRRAAAEALNIALGPAHLALEPGDRITLAGGSDLFEIAAIEDGAERQLDVRRARAAAPTQTQIGDPTAPVSTPAPTPAVSVLNLPPLPKAEGESRPLVAIYASPWRGAHALYAGAALSRRATVAQPAVMGELLWALWPGPVDRWDDGNIIRIKLYGGALASATPDAVLNGDNVFAIEGADGDWEVVQARSCELVAPNEYQLSGFLRGQLGSAPAMREPHPVGARIVKLDARLARAEIGAHEWNEPLAFAAPPANALATDPRAEHLTLTLPHAALRPWAPAHLRARREPSGDVAISWVRCARVGGDAWGPGEPPLGAAPESYVLDILDGADVLKRSVNVTNPAHLYGAADQIADFGAPPVSLRLRVAQMGENGAPGLNKELTITL